MEIFSQNLPLLNLIFALIILILGIRRWRKRKLFWVGIAFLPFSLVYLIQSVGKASVGILPAVVFFLTLTGYLLLVWALFLRREGNDGGT